jgi:hypothetical protein
LLHTAAGPFAPEMSNRIVRSFAPNLTIRLTLLLAAWTVLCMLTAVPALAQEDQRVEEVGLHLDLTGGYVGGETMSQLEQALLNVTQLALLQQLEGSLPYIVNNQTEVEQTLSTVVDSVLMRRGFTLEALKLEPGVQTVVTVSLHVTEAQVDDFEVRFVLLGNTPVIEEVVAPDEEAVLSELYATVARTPYSDSEWISGLITDTVEQKLAALEAYADFDHMVLVLPAPTTKVTVTFEPKDDVLVLSEYTLRLRSQTLLNATLQPVRDQAVHYIQSLVGAPVSFLNAKSWDIRQATFQYLVNCGALCGLYARADLEMVVCDCLLDAQLDVESERYLLGLAARVDLSKHTDGSRNGRLTGRAGVVVADNFAVYLDGAYFPGSGELYPMLGVGRLLDSSGFVGAGWDFKADAWRLQGRHDLSNDVYASADYYTDNDFDELSEVRLHYRIRDAYELQLIGNFNGEVYAAVAANL